MKSIISPILHDKVRHIFWRLSIETNHSRPVSLKHWSNFPPHPSTWYGSFSYDKHFPKFVITDGDAASPLLSESYVLLHMALWFSRFLRRSRSYVQHNETPLLPRWISPTDDFTLNAKTHAPQRNFSRSRYRSAESRSSARRDGSIVAEEPLRGMRASNKKRANRLEHNQLALFFLKNEE